MNTKFNFIGGVGRSGTSITRKLFSIHPEVLTFPFEYRFIIDPDGILDFINSTAHGWSPYTYDKKIRRLEKYLLNLEKKNFLCYQITELAKKFPKYKNQFNLSKYHGWELGKHFPNYAKHVNSLIEDLTVFKYQSVWAGSDAFKIKPTVYYSPPYNEKIIYKKVSKFFTSLFNDLFTSVDKYILVEDNTWNLLFINQLKRLFDDSKFIHVYRDPRDVVCSYIHQRWMPKDIIQSATICRDLYNQINAQISLLPDNRILEISIEELTKNKTLNIKKLFNFVGIDPPKNINDVKLSNNSFGKWKHMLTKNEISLLKPVIGETTERLGYHWT